MKRYLLKFLLFFIIIFILQQSFYGQPIIVNHACTTIKSIPENAIIQAKDNLHIAYGHTSHGSQLITGMNKLDNFMGGTGLYRWNDGPKQNTLDIDDYFVGGDLGNPDRTTWAARTRDYLNNSNNADVNVVIWSWCGEVSSASEENINTYLTLMNQLETDYPNIKFVYMTGHLDGSGLSGNLHIRNDQIREYCRNNNKTLYDFEDIESYDPDGKYFGDKNPNDNCDYDTDGNGSKDGNWATEWQNLHTEGVDWYNCSAAHTQPLNGNRKAYAAWWLWAKLAGWNGVTSMDTKRNGLPANFDLKQNYPNPFNPTTTIQYIVPAALKTLNATSQREQLIQLKIYDILGNQITTLVNKQQAPGTYKVAFNAASLPSGIYFYKLTTNNFTETKHMVLIK